MPTDSAEGGRQDKHICAEDTDEVAISMPKAELRIGCGLVRGDGAEVAAMAEDLKASAVFLDFDRTLASTRRGQSPYPEASTASKVKTKRSTITTETVVPATKVGTTPVVSSRGVDKGLADVQDVPTIRRYSPHTIDEDLCSLCSWHPNVHVVTRNRNVEDIEHFLRERGCVVRHVWHVAKGASKATVVLDPANWLLLQPSEIQLSRDLQQPVVMFVDDDVREHLCPLFLKAYGSSTAQLDSGNPEDEDGDLVEGPLRIAQRLHLHRVLFSRLVQTD